ncbi:cell division protein FtsL [Spiribacter salinus]|uniref:cell division protein FtsL n=1 Tax=Spiribacter salinus TaxID=1335746 RepID=UPI001C98B3D5|nr:cell division protein FtsL [Spiribacter salinus]MBY5269057.1 cell division protein FtsL [Spiribacter salinus]
MNRLGLVVLVLAGLVVASAIAVVETKHQSRSLFVKLEALRSERDELNTDWSRLRLEQGALATHSRVERIARDDLSLRVPDPGDATVLGADAQESSP